MNLHLDEGGETTDEKNEWKVHNRTRQQFLIFHFG
jgi:hypothetical protein